MEFPSHVLAQREHLLKYLDKLLPGYVPKDEQLMYRTFVHKSYAADFKSPLLDNERLEFLGDAVLGALIAQRLYIDYPQTPESQLTLYKIALVREFHLALVARSIQLDEMLFLGNGEEKMGGRSKDVILADAVEALIGFFTIDAGILIAQQFVEKIIYKIGDDLANLPSKSFKSMLQELTQERYKVLPEYKDEELQSDDKGNVLIFQTQIFLDGKCIATGEGSNKKKSHEHAAQIAFQKLSTSF